MSEKTINYGAHLNLAQKELRNVVLQPLATDPTSGRVGQMYFNTATNKQRFCVAVAEDGTPTWKEVGGGGVADLMFSVTYAALKQMRDGGELIPGAQYRITDYRTEVDKANVASAGLFFDVIVTADSENTLNENARATHHEGDGEVISTDCNLAAWKLKYSLDNDKTRFKWANAVYGKGVIYYLKDEHKNEAGYDFKNILFDGSIIYKGIEKFGLEAGLMYFTFVGEQRQDMSLLGARNNKIGFNPALGVNVIIGAECYYNEIGEYANLTSISETTLNVKIGNYTNKIFIGDSCQKISINNSLENINIENAVENVVVGISNIDISESNKTYEPGQVFAGTSDEPAEATENNGLVTKSQLDKAIAAIPGLSYKVVSALPTSDISKSIIYLVQKATAGTQNAYEEYLNTTGTTAGWEKIGDTEIDLSEYVTATALADALALKQNSKYVGTITGDGSTKEFVITHNLKSKDCVVSLRDETTNEVVYTDVEFTTENTATVGFADAPAVGQNYKITII